MNIVDIKYGSTAGAGGDNQDKILCEQLSEDTFVAILADGIGGLEHGDLAAETVVRSIYNTVKAILPLIDIPQALSVAFDKADKAIEEQSRNLRCKMGAAVSVVIVASDSVHCAWQGNVRLYYQKADRWCLLTEDHVKSSDSSTLLTRCVNGKGFRYPISTLSATSANVSSLLLCTDGFYLSDSCMQLVQKGEISSSHLDPQQDDASYILLELKR